MADITATKAYAMAKLREAAKKVSKDDRSWIRSLYYGRCDTCGDRLIACPNYTRHFTREMKEYASAFSYARMFK